MGRRIISFSRAYIGLHALLNLKLGAYLPNFGILGLGSLFIYHFYIHFFIKKRAAPPRAQILPLTMGLKQF